MGLREDILSLTAAYSGTTSNGTEQRDLLGAFGLEGDDATGFLEDYAEHFDVDLSAMRWEFHFNADEPPYGRRVLPIGADGKVIPFVPITLGILIAAAEQGDWRYDYPEHTLRISWKSRFSMSIAAALIVIGLVLYSFL